VDLDPKPLARLPHYLEQERRLQGVFAAVGSRLLAAAGKCCAAGSDSSEEAHTK